MNSWPFDQTPKTAALTTRQVLEEKRDVRVVIHYSDDNSWAFLCGTTQDKRDGRVVGMGEAVEIDDSLLTVADLPPGWCAQRDFRGGPWRRTKDAHRV
jgi:hypothetical protein